MRFSYLVGGHTNILIYGAGVIGSIFAAKLSLSENDVTVLARGNRLTELQANGVSREETIPSI